MLKKIFRYPIDAWAALLVLSLFVAQLAVYLYVENVWLVILASVLLLPARLSVIGYNHNHVHSATFVNPVLNRLLEIMMFFETGTSPYSGALNHIVGHHATYFQPELDTLNWKRPDGTPMSKHEFTFKAALRHYPSCFFFGKRTKGGLFRNFVIYTTICMVLLAALVVYNPVSALIVYVVPMLAMIYMLKLAAYAHHTGLPQGDHYIASRSNTSKFYNWLTWNSGYHAAHHFKQALHWSLLPAYHAELAAKIPQDLHGEGWGEEYVRQGIKTAVKLA
jgi:fatty acid desaturase